MSFKEFKKNQEKLKQTIEKNITDETKNYKDERIWKYTLDSIGNSQNVIRFLPQQDLSKPAFIANHSHFIKKNGKVFFENCLTNYGEKCPICEHAFSLFHSGLKEEAKPFYRKTNYISNILIVKEEVNQENQGKVFLYKFPKTIHGMISQAITGYETENEEGDVVDIPSFNPFDITEGKNFLLKLWTKGEGKEAYIQYDKSKFLSKTTEICDGNEEDQEKVFNSIYSLDEFTDRSNFNKTFDEIQDRLNTFLMVKNITGTVQDQVSVKQNVTENKAPKSSQENDDDDDIDIDDLLSDDDDIPF